MRIAGIIAEYNPFHNGHAWHIAETRRLTGCDYVIACMAGHFTQRGDMAMWSKWDRARMALSCGVDAVFELPALFTVRTADVFARGGVAILGGLGVDVLSFGSETSDPDALKALAEIREHEPEAVSENLRRKLGRGMSHARARGEAIAEYLNLPFDDINRPNLILAAEYLRAMARYCPEVAPCAVRRTGGYHDDGMGTMASASAVRAAFRRGDAQLAMAAMPQPVRRYAEPEPMHPPDDLLMDRLRNMTVEAMAALPDVGEGLEQRLYRLCREASTREDLLEALKCKRYTRARLSRLLTHALLGVTRSMTDANPMPSCARLLGARGGAEALLTELNRRTSIPIMASPRAMRDDPVFQLECRATDLWALAHDRPGDRLPGREYTEKFVKV